MRAIHLYFLSGDELRRRGKAISLSSTKSFLLLLTRSPKHKPSARGRFWGGSWIGSCSSSDYYLQTGSGCDGSEVLEPAEATLDGVAEFIGPGIEWEAVHAVDLVGDYRERAASCDVVA